MANIISIWYGASFAPVLVACIRRDSACVSACLSALAGQLSVAPVDIGSSLPGPALSVAVLGCLLFLGLLHRM